MLMKEARETEHVWQWEIQVTLKTRNHWRTIRR